MFYYFFVNFLIKFYEKTNIRMTIVKPYLSLGHNIRITLYSFSIKILRFKNSGNRQIYSNKSHKLINSSIAMSAGTK